MNQWTPAEMPVLNGKVAIVTGANSGLGFHAALELSRAGAQVILACRSRDKAEVAVRQIRLAVPQAQPEFMALDLSDLDTVASFAERFKAAHSKLHILHNNAGVMALPLLRTRQGFEMQIGTNHLGHFALTGRLMERLLATPGARIVNTASLAHNWTRGLDLADLNWEHKRYWKWDAYGKSKLANLLFTYELQRRLSAAGAGLLSLAAHPGYAATQLQLAGPEMEKSSLGRLVMQAGNALLAQSAERGAYPQLYAATMPEVRGGQYFGPHALGQSRGYPKRVGSNRASRDEDAARALWTASEQFTGVRFALA